VASGIYSVNKRLGTWGWAFVGVLVALPRVYLGGHYFTDILAGLLTGLVSYVIALSLLESTLVSWGETLFDYDWCLWRRRLAEIAIFLWIWAVTTGFRDAVAIGNLLARLMNDAGSW
jgi:hypothetical protein